MSIEQDIKQQGIEETKFNRAYEDAERKVLEDTSTADGFIQQLYQLLSDTEIQVLCGALRRSTHINKFTAFNIMSRHYNKYVDDLIAEEME